MARVAPPLRLRLRVDNLRRIPIREGGLVVPIDTPQHIAGNAKEVALRQAPVSGGAALVGPEPEPHDFCLPARPPRCAAGRWYTLPCRHGAVELIRETFRPWWDAFVHKLFVKRHDHKQLPARSRHGLPALPPAAALPPRWPEASVADTDLAETSTFMLADEQMPGPLGALVHDVRCIHLSHIACTSTVCGALVGLVVNV